MNKIECPLFFNLGTRSRDMTISLFEARGVRFELSSEEEIANISAPVPEIKNVRTLCFLKLLKLKNGKWP